MKRLLAIIPARGGSKRIPGKNIIDFCGRPLIAYSLEAARNSDLFSEIHVSTDDDTIALSVADLGFPVPFMRSPELADDMTPLVPVLRWVLQEYERRGQSFDGVCLLMACAPLIEASDLVKGYEVFKSSEYQRPAISVARYPAPVEWAYSMRTDNQLEERQPGMFSIRSQDIEPAFYDTGGFVFFPSRLLLDEVYQGGGTMTGIELPRHKAVDIDEPEDLETAKAIFLGLKQIERN